MKKYIAAAIIGLLSVTAVIGDTDIDKEDFLFLTPENKELYPELDYQANPAVLCDVDQNLMLANLDLSSTYTESLKTRIDDSEGGHRETFILFFGSGRRFDNVSSA